MTRGRTPSSFGRRRDARDRSGGAARAALGAVTGTEKRTGSSSTPVLLEEKRKLIEEYAGYNGENSRRCGRRNAQDIPRPPGRETEHGKSGHAPRGWGPVENTLLRSDLVPRPTIAEEQVGCDPDHVQSREFFLARETGPDRANGEAPLGRAQPVPGRGAGQIHDDE